VSKGQTDSSTQSGGGVRSSGDAKTLACALAELAKAPLPFSVEQLPGGRNNRVDLVRLTNGGKAVLKRYHHDPADTRNRLAAEWAFLTLVWNRDIRIVPQPLATLEADHAALYSFAEGGKAEMANANLVDQAIDFIVAINAYAEDAENLAPASEACFTLSEHISGVVQRVARLDTIDSDAPLAGEARELVATRLRPVWERVHRNIEEKIEASGLDRDARCTRPIVSPSDFGFHNALISDSGVATFIDFEYAGRDDPAKLICDFFCQPEIPVPRSHYPHFRNAVLQGIGAEEGASQRCDLLLDAYAVKWMCIMLNEFLPAGARRRAYAEAGEAKTRARRQLNTLCRALGKLEQG